MQVMNFAHCLHVVLDIGKYTFSGVFFLEGGGVRGERYMGGSFHGEIFHWERKFFMKGLRIPQYFLKNDQQLNRKKQDFLTESKKQH